MKLFFFNKSFLFLSNLEKNFTFFNSGNITKINSKEILSLLSFSKISTLIIFFSSINSLSLDNFEIPSRFIFIFFIVSKLCGVLE